MVRILKSMPMVVMNEGVNESSLKRSRQHDFPTPVAYEEQFDEKVVIPGSSHVGIGPRYALSIGSSMRSWRPPVWGIR